MKKAIGGTLSSTVFFIFQNKNIASALVEGMKTGIARYLATGRPAANQHQSWKDMYINYWKSHYGPALNLAFGWVIYTVLALQNRVEGKLPMFLVVISFTSWLVAPIFFSPLTRFDLVAQDARDFGNFIVGGVGIRETDLPEVLSRGKRSLVRNLYECGLAEELCVWSELPYSTLVMGFVLNAISSAFLLFALPAEVLDYMPLYLPLLAVSAVFILGYFSSGNNNIFLILSCLVWALAMPAATVTIGSRFASPTPVIRLPEYVISLAVFLQLLDLTKSFVLLTCRGILSTIPCGKQQSTTRMYECIRLCFVYFGVHQLQLVKASAIMVINVSVASFLALIDRLTNLHTWFLLNSELARTKYGEKYMEKKATFYELDGEHRFDLWGSDSEFEDDLVETDVDDGSTWTQDDAA